MYMQGTEVILLEEAQMVPGRDLCCDWILVDVCQGHGSSLKQIMGCQAREEPSYDSS